MKIPATSAFGGFRNSLQEPKPHRMCDGLNPQIIFERGMCSSGGGARFRRGKPKPAGCTRHLNVSYICVTMEAIAIAGYIPRAFRIPLERPVRTSQNGCVYGTTPSPCWPRSSLKLTPIGQQLADVPFKQTGILSDF